MYLSCLFSLHYENLEIPNFITDSLYNISLLKYIVQLGNSLNTFVIIQIMIRVL